MISISRNVASIAELESLLRTTKFLTTATEALPTTPIGAYVRKLDRYSERFEAWIEGRLVGLVAMYCNDVLSKRAFVPVVVVVQESRGQHVATRLLALAIREASTRGFDQIDLEVAQGNSAAISLYKGSGFGFYGANAMRLVLPPHEEDRAREQPALPEER